MGAALCLIMPFCLLINRPKDYYKPRYDAAYYGCQEPITITYTDKNKKEKKYLAYCGEKWYMVIIIVPIINIIYKFFFFFLENNKC